MNLPMRYKDINFQQWIIKNKFYRLSLLTWLRVEVEEIKVVRISSGTLFTSRSSFGACLAAAWSRCRLLEFLQTSMTLRTSCTAKTCIITFSIIPGIHDLYWNLRLPTCRSNRASDWLGHHCRLILFVISGLVWRRGCNLFKINLGLFGSTR